LSKRTDSELPPFDPFRIDFQEEPGGYLRARRSKTPIFYEQSLGQWVICGYDLARAALRNTTELSTINTLDPLVEPSSRSKDVLATYGFAPQRVLVNTDGEQHRRRRRQLTPPLSEAAVRRAAPMAHRVVDGYIDKFQARGSAELVGELLWGAAADIGLAVAGVPEDRIAEARECAVVTADFWWGRPTEDEQIQVAHRMGRWWQLAGELVAELRRRPGAGWIPHAIEVAREDRSLDEAVLQTMMMSGLVAAHETTMNAAANALLLLLERPAVWEALREDPTLTPRAVEECLRLGASVMCWRRRAAAPLTLGGQSIEAGEDVLIVLDSANRDERRFCDPDEFDLDRRDAHRHLSFGSGEHVCAGAALARMEIALVIDSLATRLPGLSLGRAPRYRANASFRGPIRLDVRWHP